MLVKEEEEDIVKVVVECKRRSEERKVGKHQRKIVSRLVRMAAYERIAGMPL
jgi:hypothetical protein